METLNRNLEALTAFHLVATEGSFTLAANKLGLSKSLISKQVSRLETHLGTQLFHRTTRTLGLTETGKMLLTYSQKIMNFSDEAETRLKDLSNGDSGDVRISVPVGLGVTFFSSFIPEIEPTLPKVTFHADITSDFRDLVRDRVDFGIRVRDDKNPEAVARFLGKVRDVICVSPQYLKKIKISNDPTDLEGKNCIRYAGNSSWNDWALTSSRKSVSIAVSGQIIANTYQGALGMCLGGLGIVRLPFYLAADHLRDGRLVQLFAEYQIATHPLYLVYLKGEYPTVKHRVVKSAILKWFESRPEIFVARGS
jgi:DNA-binding transcriptional LysR family regulator